MDQRKPALGLKEKISDKKGFTLLEMVLTTALVSIFFSMTALIIPTWYRAYAKTIRLNYARQIADSVIAAIEEETRFANQIEVTGPSGGDSVQRLTGKNGSRRFTIPMEGSSNLIDGLVYDENYFMNHDIMLEFSLNAEKNWCTVTVTVTEDGEMVLTKKRTVGLSGENN